MFVALWDDSANGPAFRDVPLHSGPTNRRPIHVQGWAGMGLLQTGAVLNHCCQPGFPLVQIICAAAKFHLQELHVCLIAAFLHRARGGESQVAESGSMRGGEEVVGDPSLEMLN